MIRRPTFVLVAAAFVVLASGSAFAGAFVHGSIGVSVPCQPRNGVEQRATILLVEDWPDDALFDVVRRCENDAVDFTAAWDDAKAESFLAKARALGFREKPIDNVACASDVETVCEKHGATEYQRFDGDGHDFDRCNGRCKDGTTVRTIRLELDRSPSR